VQHGGPSLAPRPLWRVTSRDPCRAGRPGVSGRCSVEGPGQVPRVLLSISLIMSDEVPLGEASVAYEKFDKRVEGYTKVVLHP